MANEQTVAEKIASTLIVNDPLRAVLRQRSSAYGSVEGALESYHGFATRGQESDARGRQAFAELIAAIQAPRVEAEKIADQLAAMARNV